ncbi:NAD(P)/FAD-dependent oxidoreductase [Levilactobacillus tangyuanensis]|uniref:Ferredoxin--NADP reductase n=1 Tax=Levilactobacillus tangyuanensis TaxID=2486021 RepID=A0ABW1TKL1_9LACO|nr:NAD(P)/FAD-dependent oxidoreductase [Levilactobacillus tangyuanensis]
MENYDLTIIGGGPAGIFAGVYAGMHNAKAQIVESLPNLGGQVAALYPEKQILDIAGFPAISGRNLIQQQQAQLNQFPLAIKTGAAVTNVTANAAGFLVQTNQETTQTRAVIVAVGNGAFAPRKLAVPGAEALTGKKLFYSIPNLAAFKGHDVMIAGGGDAAIDQALMLATVAKSVTLLHRRSQFRGLPHMVDLLAASSVQVKTPYLIREVSEAAGKVLVTLKPVGVTDELRQQRVDDLVVSYGFTADHSALAAWDVDLATDQQLIAVDRQMATSVPGIYAIGDGVMYPGKQPLIAVGYGEAPVAVQAIMAKYFPTRRSPVHSTSMTLPE